MTDKTATTTTTAAAATAEPVKAELYKIQDPTRFSDSHIWKLMLEYYSKSGVSAWSSYTVPFLITCNTFIAQKYAILINNLIQNKTQKTYILELGAGSGKLGFHILCELERMKVDWSKLTYVMSDFADLNIQYWKAHSALTPFIEKGALEFAKFDVYKDVAITLDSGTTLPEKTEIIVIANYVFDSMAVDAFKIDSNKIYESKLAIGSTVNEQDAMDTTILQRMVTTWSYDETSVDHYKRDIYDKILSTYYEMFKDSIIEAHVIFPIAVLALLERVFAKMNVTVIVGDKGFSETDSFTLSGAPHIAVHGSFSVMVNLHAIGLYFENMGGASLHNPQQDAGIKISAFSNSTFSDEFKDLFDNHICDFGPTDFHTMQRAVVLNKELTVEGIHSLLKLSNYDPDTFFNIKDIIVENLTTVSKNLRQDVYRSMGRVLKNYYFLNRDRDIYFELGRLFFKTRDFKQAIEFYNKSIDTLGIHNVTLYNIALCYKEMGDKESALTFLKDSVKLDSTYERAKVLLIQLHAEIQACNVAKIALE